MKSQRFKDIYFTAVLPATYVSHLVWKFRLRRRVPEQLRRGENSQVWLHVGSGAKRHPNFVNIDGNVRQRTDMWLDLRNGLPFPTGCVHRIYACHVFEHFYFKELSEILGECFRVLRPKGGIRLLAPSVELAIEAYLRGDKDWFPDFPVKFSSLGGRFVNFLFCDDQHQLAFDFSFAAEMLSAAGFSEIRLMEPHSSALFPPHVVEELEPRENYIESSLVIEAIKSSECQRIS